MYMYMQAYSYYLIEARPTLTYGVGGGLLALLVLSKVSGHCSVGCFTFHSLAVGADQHACHHPQTPIAWGETREKESNM